MLPMIHNVNIRIRMKMDSTLYINITFSYDVNLTSYLNLCWLTDGLL